MHRIARDGPAFVRAITPDLSGHDAVVLMFGEIDVRCHLIPAAEKSGRSIQAEAHNLATRYLARMAAMKADLDGTQIVLAQPPFPSDRRPNTELPACGTLDQRIAAHRALSAALQELAEAAGLLFLPMPPRYADSRGALRRIYSDDGVHMMPCEAKAYVSALASLLGRPLRFRASPLSVLLRRWNYLFGGNIRRRGLPVTKKLESW
ncbi:hypothetical protein CWR43_31230 [Rhizobium sullae]|uniref:SGNH hydrolase-type esterase domain-containing protein n=2 Tax=Rhizobium sullae TaxID=50338 RepID=A0A2N0D0U1_RHISU|nr:hypothetical protein CWR43_31230 [Rhizobium sullae]